MSDYNDFGFTAVDQEELKTKTGEDATAPAAVDAPVVETTEEESSDS